MSVIALHSNFKRFLVGNFNNNIFNLNSIINIKSSNFKNHFLFFCVFLLALTVFVSAQTKERNFLQETQPNKSTPLFQKLEKYPTIDQRVATDFYPLKTGDFWEYIEGDTVTFMGNKRSMRYSLAKEVMGDSVIGDYMYKKIIYEVCANSIQRADSCELQRIDSIGNVYYFFNGKDQLRYDFSKGMGERFASPYTDRYWEVAKKYTVIGFGDTLQAIDFYLYNKDGWYERTETVTEKFGMTYYYGKAYSFDEGPTGNFFGGVLNGNTYGNLLVKRQKVDWSEYYPLHVGDFWKYEGYEGVFEITTTNKVISDTLMPDNKIYRVIEHQKLGGPYPSRGIVFERVESDNNENVMSWHKLDSTTVRKIKFSSCLGDTFSSEFSGASYVFDNKSYDEIHYSLYPNLTNDSYNFSHGLGLTSVTGEFYYNNLVGAVINGKVYGDTTITSIYDKPGTFKVFELYQNYPNPFNPTTIIKYSLNETNFVSLKIFDLLGREVISLVEQEQHSGIYSVNFNANYLASGIYIYTLKFGCQVTSKKLILIK